RPNLTVATHALVERVVVEQRDGVRRARAVDVRFGSAARLVGRRHGAGDSGILLGGGEPRRIAARREIVLAAGAIGSPQLLQLSGIGPGALLAEHGIAVLHDLPGVGENLHDHLQIRSVYKVRNTRTLNRRARSWHGKLAMALEYALFRTRPLTMPPSQLGAFAKSDPERSCANLEWHVQPLSLDRFGAPLHEFDAITPSVCNLQPTSRGHVRLTS